MNHSRRLTRGQLSLAYNYRLCSTVTSRPSKTVDRILRVDHAGELGADRIYAGQMAVLGKRHTVSYLLYIFVEMHHDDHEINQELVNGLCF